MQEKVEMCFFDREQAINADGKTTSLVIPYIVFGTAEEDRALELVKAAAPQKYNGVALDSIEIEERLAKEIFKIRAIYPENPASGSTDEDEDPSFSFDTSGGSKHITQSLETVGSYPEDAPDFEGAIEVDDDNNVNGCDIVMPITTFSETHYYSAAKVTASYKKKVASLTGTVNNDSFKGYEPGEILFQGAAGSRRGKKSSDKWEITYKFAVSPNAKNLKVGDITVSTKEGWDYLWVKYAPTIDNTAKNLIKKPKYVYVERVYERESFSFLK